MTALKFLVLGFLVKIITGLDDTITHVPAVAGITHTRIGKIAYLIGTLLAIIVAIIIAISFSSILNDFPYYRFITAGLLLLLATGIYFNIFFAKQKLKTEKKLLQMKKISAERFTKLLVIGFVASLATVMDDIIAYMSLFTMESATTNTYAIIGILSATILEIIMVMYFSEQIVGLKYKKEIAATGLVILATLIVFQVI